MTETLAALLIFLFPRAYSPGPGNMVFGAMGARHGVAGTWRASLGYHAATWLVTLGIGRGVALGDRPNIARAVQVAGAVGATLTKLWARPDAAARLNRGLALMLATVAVWMAAG